MRTVKAKILTMVLSLLAVSLLTVGISSALISYSGTVSTLRQTLSATALAVSSRIEHQLNEYKNAAIDSGIVPELSSLSSRVADKKTIVDQYVKQYGFQRGNIIGADGISIFDGKDYSDRGYYQSSMKGEAAVSEPLISKITGALSIMISAPIWEKGMVGGKVVGVIYYVPTETFLNDIVASIKPSANSEAYMINKNGVTIADEDPESVKNQENIGELANEDKTLAELSSIHSDMMSGKSGATTYKVRGSSNIMAFAPVVGTDGWSIGLSAPLSDFTGDTVAGILTMAGILVAAIILATILTIRLARSISTPIRQCAGRLLLLSEGNLSAPVPECHGKDETSALLRDLNTTVHELGAMLSDASSHMGRMAEGDLSGTQELEYKGDFSSLATSIRSISSALNEAMGQINIASEQVSAGANQVSDSAQALSQGAIEQSASVEELAKTVSQIAAQISQNAESAAGANGEVINVGMKVEECDEHMSGLNLAMQDITSASSKIGKIIKTIEDIAFQTNILALNAAVEAARAGAAGKGFAVVADEVRNLASKSAEAAKNTTELIEGSMHAVERGSAMAEATNKSLHDVVDGMQHVAEGVDTIMAASGEQASSIQLVNDGMDKISAVVQTNSATSEQSAAAAEELSAQASLLKELVSKFKLRSAEKSLYISEERAVQSMGRKY